MELDRTLRGHSSAISSVKFSPDGLNLASSSNDKTVKIWDIVEGKPVTTLVGHSMGISDISWTNDSRFLATASDDHTVKLYDLRTNDEIHTFEGHENYVMCVDFDPTSNYLCSGSFDKTFRIWDVRTRVSLHRVQAHSDAVVSGNFSMDGKILVTGGFDGFVKIWNMEDVSLVNSYSVDESHTSISFVRWAPNDRFLLVGSFDDNWRILNYSTGKFVKTYNGHFFNDYCIFAAFFLSVGRYIVSGSADRTVCVWDINTKELQKLEGHDDVVVAVSAHPSKGIIASGALERDKTIKLWKQKESS